MDDLLHNDYQRLDEIIKNATVAAQTYFKNQSNLPPSRYVEDLIMEDLPFTGIGAQGALSFFEENYAGKMNNSAGPRYFGFVTGGSTPASIVGDWMVSTYDQNACGSNDSIAPQIEHQTIHFFKQLFGLDEQYFGSFVTGATLSNFVGLVLGRQWVGEQSGVDISNEGFLGPVNVLSATPHSSILKSLSMAGFGRKSLIKVKTLANREAVDVNLLEAELKRLDTPVIVVANAGTVNTVDFDDLEAIGNLKAKYNFWLHVDAAFGGFAAISHKYSSYLNGINHADSITIDAHKWLNVPYDAGMQFTKHKQLQLKVFQNSASYLGDPTLSPDFFHYTPENSRRFRALPSWFSLMAYGKQGFQEIVERNCDMAKLLADYISKSQNFKLLAPVKMNVVCFSFSKEDITIEEIRTFLNAVRDDGRAFFTPTVYQGVPAIRAAISNWMTTKQDIDIAFQALINIKTKIKVSTSV